MCDMRSVLAVTPPAIFYHFTRFSHVARCANVVRHQMYFYKLKSQGSYPALPDTYLGVSLGGCCQSVLCDAFARPITTFVAICMVVWFVKTNQTTIARNQVEACIGSDPIGDITIAGTKVAKCRYGKPGAQSDYEARLRHDTGSQRMNYIFICTTEDATICDQMLATFKFTN